MSFVKLDCGILDSTLWLDRDAREIFITAILMARPKQITDSVEQIEVRSLELTGFKVPAGCYGFIGAAGSGIVRRAGLEVEAGLAALERLGRPELDSRTPDFEGRRMVRVAGGYLVLNYMLYRDKDHGAAERMRVYRAKKAKKTERSKNEDGRERAFGKAVGDGDEQRANDIVDRTGTWESPEAPE